MILRLRIHIPAAVDVDVPPLFWQAIFFRVLYRKKWKRILFVPTGALLSKVSFNEGDPIPGIAHAVVIEQYRIPDMM